MALGFVRDRIEKVLEVKNSNANALYKDKSLARRMYYQMEKPSTISCELIYTILDRFPDVSADWLLRGIGTMIIQSRQSIYAHDVVVGEGNQLAKDGGSINNGCAEINIDYKEQYLITKGELEKVKAMLEIYEPIAKSTIAKLNETKE